MARILHQQLQDRLYAGRPHVSSFKRTAPPRPPSSMLVSHQDTRVVDAIILSMRQTPVRPPQCSTLRSGGRGGGHFEKNPVRASDDPILRWCNNSGINRTSGLPQVYPRDTPGLPEIYLRSTSGLLQVCPKSTSGLPKGYPRVTPGLP